jgi:hypothetical protein
MQDLPTRMSQHGKAIRRLSSGPPCLILEFSRFRYCSHITQTKYRFFWSNFRMSCTLCIGTWFWPIINALLARVSFTACNAAVWSSDSSVLCKVGHGVIASMWLSPSEPSFKAVIYSVPVGINSSSPIFGILLHRPQIPFIFSYALSVIIDYAQDPEVSKYSGPTKPRPFVDDIFASMF